MRRRTDRRGFTLIEVLVALAIVTVSLLAALRAAGMGASNAVELRSRLLASWVAQNALEEHRARGDWLTLGAHRRGANQAGAQFTMREEVTSTPNPAFRRIDITVYDAADESRALARSSAVLTLATAP